MTKQVEQRICLKFCVKLEHSCLETIQMIPKAKAIGNWWLAASSWQHACRCITSCAEFLVKHQIAWVLRPPHTPSRLGALQLLAFPKTKITFEREEISDCRWDSGKYNGAADGEQENCVRSQGAYFEGDRGGVIVLCTMFLVSSSIKASIFHSTWLDTFWIDLMYL